MVRHAGYREPASIIIMSRIENTGGRSNQRNRTRKDLLLAASRLLKTGKTPSMDDVAEEAMVSRATAYRYFPKLEALLVEAPLDGPVSEVKDLFNDNMDTDPVERVDRAEAALHEMCFNNEAQLRVMLAHSLGSGSDAAGGETLPVRQNRRSQLIESALAPARGRFSDENYEKLCRSLAMVFGTESMIVFRDVLQLDPDTARAVKSWAVRALVGAALDKQ